MSRCPVHRAVVEPVPHPSVQGDVFGGFRRDLRVDGLDDDAFLVKHPDPVLPGELKLHTEQHDTERDRAHFRSGRRVGRAALPPSQIRTRSVFASSYSTSCRFMRSRTSSSVSRGDYINSAFPRSR